MGSDGSTRRGSKRSPPTVLAQLERHDRHPGARKGRSPTPPSSSTPTNRSVHHAGAHAKGCRNGPAKRTRLTAVDPVARLEDVQELRRGDLGQADGRNVAGLAPKGFVHLLVD